MPNGDQVVRPLKELAEGFTHSGFPVFASQDWHPAKTSHFQDFGGIWPVHCVQQSWGAAFHPELHLPQNTVILSKGAEPDTDGYSAFAGKDSEGRSLQELLTSLEVQHLFIGGLATDYCVRATVLDALQQGFAVTVLKDCIAGVDVQPGDSARALEEMNRAGARMGTSKDMLNGLNR